MKIKDIHLLAFYVTKPRDPKMTKVKGYMSNPDNIRYDERIEFTKGLNGKDSSYAKIVLNLNTKTIVKNNWGTERTFDDYFKYFLEAYPEYIINVMGQLDMPYLEQFIPKEPVTDVEVKDAEVKAE
jgi:hypothetical protein